MHSLGDDPDVEYIWVQSNGPTNCKLGEIIIIRLSVVGHISPLLVIRDVLALCALVICVFEESHFLTVGAVSKRGAFTRGIQRPSFVGDDIKWQQSVELEEIEILRDGVPDGDEWVGDTEFCGLEWVEGDDFSQGLAGREGKDDGFEGDVIFVEGVGGMRGIEVVEDAVFGGSAAADADEGE